MTRSLISKVNTIEKGNLINGATQRVMYMNGGTIFGGDSSEYIKCL
ncbi:hypothetical protein [Clostridium estertheticum]|nr:hypothetical protein [Clostridium estertheticum]MCB2339079.1 hypothetical protein [Clostridium estertheticum]